MLTIIQILLFFQTAPYEQWTGKDAAYSNVLMQFLASNDLLPVVMAVSLLIWFTLLTFIIRLDFKITHLEKEVEEKIRQA